MEQMRRKLKFKEKEKRKEMKEIQRQEYMSKPVIDPLLNHDFGTINQLKMSQANQFLGGNQKPQIQQSYAGAKSGVMSSLMPNQYANNNQIYYQQSQSSNTNQQQESQDYNQSEQQESTGTTWEEIQNNYFRTLQGLEVQYNQDQYQQELHQPRQKLQPYQMKSNQDAAEIQSRPIIYKQNLQKIQQIEGQPVQTKNGQINQNQSSLEEAKQQVQQQNQNQQQRQKPKKKQDTLDDPLDPSHGDKNFRDQQQKEKNQLKDSQQQQTEMQQTNTTPLQQQTNQFKGVSADIKKALGLDLPQFQPKTELIQEEREVKEIEKTTKPDEKSIVPQKRFIPAALRKQMNQGSILQPKYQQKQELILPQTLPQQQQLDESKNKSTSDTAPATKNMPDQQQIQVNTIQNNKNALSLLQGYGSSSSDSEDDNQQYNTFKQSYKPSLPPARQMPQNDFALPGLDLMFGTILSKDEIVQVNNEPKKDEKDLNDELLKFMNEINQ
ncbi:UNKNOWN [Stylonychia lemnae]|uniref:Uncharacterized protein n=1 Tax=Stylonychia lemnae TaxID=5949 RepID=A0A078BBV9_STYLE|nr:UNKNOWN [Stylonychia lemnae]|eukprot:CDW91078.1 UNKNOWN [Stylonychia lemnae]